MLCTVHHGPYGPPEADVSLAKTWQVFWRHTAENYIGIDEGPEREVYVEDHNTQGDHPERFATELQIPLLFPRWMRCFEKGLDRDAGEGVRRRVMEGSERLTATGDVRERYEWTRRAMEQLDAAVPDEDKRREIMCGCAHIYPKERRAWLKEQYRRLGSVDALIEFIRKDPGYEGAPYYRDPTRPGNVVLIDKGPQQRTAYEEATDPVARRAAACHCPTIKAAILAGEEIPFTFCGCGTGWFKPVWEEIVGRRRSASYARRRSSGATTGAGSRSICRRGCEHAGASGDSVAREGDAETAGREDRRCHRGAPAEVPECPGREVQEGAHGREDRGRHLPRQVDLHEDHARLPPH